MRANTALTILYVSDLQRATAFYDAAFSLEKAVDVPVYVEYVLNSGARLGLMPQTNTQHFLGSSLGERVPEDGCPRAEIYLRIDDVEATMGRLKAAGAVCTSPLADRDWGDRAAYFMDGDGYVIGIAQEL